MAPGYRTTATNTRRGNRSGFAEHDDFEGLPVRQWRKEEVTFAPSPEREEDKKDDIWAEELPHGMPKDTHLLPQHSQELLKLARSGKLYRKRPLDDEDADTDGLPGDKLEKKDSAVDEGFRVKIWRPVPRNIEEPTISYLAPRKKGAIMLPSKALGTQQTTGPSVVRATVRKFDAAGNSYMQTVNLAEGQPVDGEIISTSVVPAPEVAAETPQAVATPGVKMEQDDGSRNLGDVEMMESSVLDDDNGDGGSGNDDDGDGDESGTPATANEDQEMKDAPSQATSESAAEPAPTSAAAPQQPGPNLAPPPLDTSPSRVEGSPLKNVTLRSPTETEQISPIATTATNADFGLTEMPGEPTLSLQPSPTEPQQPTLLSQPTLTSLPSRASVTEEPVADVQPSELVAPTSAEIAPEDTMGVVAITSSEPVATSSTASLLEQTGVLPAAVEQLPLADDTAPEPATEDIPLLSSEEPMPGQASGPAAEQQPATEQEPVTEQELVTEQEPATEEEPVTEQEPATEQQPPPPAAVAAAEPQAPLLEIAHTDDGTDDSGFDVLGSLTASLNQQAEEDAPPAVPAAPECLV
ncbi:hypothetical protein VM1G_00494 [Cytospora mali]|uniref:Zonadhesin n=1 Tax=Cytospora mali TaxID=578113 RepID=A0A194VLK2_CYTMA|nr:hypothetical protein VM1G_00494 [Valsa mali]